MIQDIIARIKAGVPELKLVGGSAQFSQSAELQQPAAVPACFVIVGAEAPGAPAAANLLIQTVQVEIGVVLVVSNIADVTGLAAAVDMEQLRAKVKDQLFGWEPPDAGAPLARGPSNLLAYHKGHVWWQDIYTTSYFDKAKQ